MAEGIREKLTSRRRSVVRGSFKISAAIHGDNQYTKTDNIPDRITESSIPLQRK